MKVFDWSKPQRQPAAGLAIVFLHTVWEVAKRLWPLLLLMVIGKQGRVSRYEVIALIFLVITILTALFRFLYFRFYIEANKLIIKKGWLNKETQVIPIEKIQTVNIEQGPLHQLLNVVKVSIDTAGSQKAEATIDSLHKSMAEELRQQLLSNRSAEDQTVTEIKPAELLIRLQPADLMKLSISANHLEAFFILLSFFFGLYENLKDIDESLFAGMDQFLPEGALFPLLILAIFILAITIIVSTLRIFLRFHDFKMTRNEQGFQIRSGLLNVRERIVSLPKIQYVSWKANWIRRLMGLWMLEYHIAGGDELKNQLKVIVPVTRNDFIPLVANAYHALPDTSEAQAVTMHKAFITRRTLLLGLLPAIIFSIIFWWQLQLLVLVFLVLPLLVFVITWNIRKKFRLWAMEDVLRIKKGILGEEQIIMQWHKLQGVVIKQNIYQRRKGLAGIHLHTAGGTVRINYISIEAAREIADFALYKTESSSKGWMQH